MVLNMVYRVRSANHVQATRKRDFDTRRLCRPDANKPITGSARPRLVASALWRASRASRTAMRMDNRYKIHGPSRIAVQFEKRRCEMNRQFLILVAALTAGIGVMALRAATANAQTTAASSGSSHRTAWGDPD